MAQSFQTFNFDQNEEFLTYLKRFDQHLNDIQIERLRKKWYRTIIDPTFEIDTSAQSQSKPQQPPQQSQEPPQQPKQQTHQQQEQAPQQAPQQQPNQPRQSLPITYQLEGLLKVCYFPCLGFVIIPGMSLYLNIGSLVICLMAIARMVGRPQFNQQYLIRLMPNEFLGNTLFIVALLGGRSSMVYQMPLALHFLIGACEFWARLNPDLSGVLKKVTDTVRTNRNVIMLNKQKIEVYLFLYSIVGLLIGSSSFLQTLILFQFLTLKSKTNSTMQYAQQQLKHSYESTLVHNPKVPGVLQNVFRGLWTLYDKLMNVF